MAKTDIIQELNELESSLASLSGADIYQVPPGYFESFASQVLDVIKGVEFIGSLPQQNPYQTPLGYFDGLAENIMENIRNHADYQTSLEELGSISPLLNSLKKVPVYSVPEGYFENFRPAVAAKPVAKVVSISSRKWFKYAAAAVITGIVVLGSVLFINSREKIDPRKNPSAWVEKNMKKVDKEDINEFVKLADEQAQVKEGSVATVKKEEMKDLMKDIPSTEIDQFLNETKTYEDANETSLN
jgi:hypothetical protein